MFESNIIQIAALCVLVAVNVLAHLADKTINRATAIHHLVSMAMLVALILKH